MPGVELVGGRRRPARAGARRSPRECGTTALADYRELLDRVDAVTIAVPTVLHREVAGAFLDAGHRHAGREADGRHRWPRPSSSSRWPGRPAPSSRSATSSGSTPRSQALDGLAVRPKYITAERLSTYTFRSTDIGVVLDLMIHDLDLVLSLIAAPVRSVAAVGVSVFGEPRGRRQRPDRVRGRQRGQPDRQPGQLHGRRGRCGSGARRATPRSTSPPKQATLVRPSDQLRRGRLDLEGVDLSQPAAVKEHLFGKILRVDQVQTEGREPLALELEDFVAGGAGRVAPAGQRRGRPARRCGWPTRSSAASSATMGRRPAPRLPLPSETGSRPPGPPCLADQEPEARTQSRHLSLIAACRRSLAITHDFVIACEQQLGNWVRFVESRVTSQ